MSDNKGRGVRQKCLAGLRQRVFLFPFVVLQDTERKHAGILCLSLKPYTWPFSFREFNTPWSFDILAHRQGWAITSPVHD